MNSSATRPSSHSNTSKNVFIIAGEASGDQHGSLLIAALKKAQPALRFAGIGGDKMIAAGLESLVPLERMAVMGFVEVIRHLCFFRQTARMLLEKMAEVQPAAVILIDYPGFNLRLARQIKERLGIPVIYYISPQLWAWKEKRAELVRKYVDLMLVIFPFEEKWYAQRNITARFVGHPFLDVWTPRSKAECSQELDLDSDRLILALFPGSRRQELDRHLKIMLDAASKLREKIPELQVLLGLAPGFDPKEVAGRYRLNGIKILQGNGRTGLEAADLAFVASGTATMEAAIFGTPMVIVYKLAPVSWWIGRKLVKVPFAGMANLIAGEEIVPELLQDQATSTELRRLGEKFLRNPELREQTRKKLRNVTNSLGGAGASARAAAEIMQILSLDHSDV